MKLELTYCQRCNGLHEPGKHGKVHKLDNGSLIEMVGLVTPTAEPTPDRLRPEVTILDEVEAPLDSVATRRGENTGGKPKKLTLKMALQQGLVTQGQVQRLDTMGYEIVLRNIEKHRARQQAYRKRKGS